jgi:hypothetical protein
MAIFKEGQWQSRPCVFVMNSERQDNVRLPESALANLEQTFLAEAVVWKCLRHPNIVPFVGVLCLPSEISLVSAWMIGGALPMFLREHGDVDRKGLVRPLMMRRDISFRMTTSADPRHHGWPELLAFVGHCARRSESCALRSCQVLRCH